MQHWDVRQYKDGDEIKIYELWEALHPDKKENKDEWLSWWNWMYKENPSGNGIIFLAVTKEKVIGQYALIPMLMKIREKVIIGSRAIHAMTHPENRRQGIFQTLGKITLSYAKEKGIPVVFATTNKLSGPGSIQKLDMFSVSSLRLFFYPCHWESLFQHRIHNTVLLRSCVGIGNLLQQTIYKKRIPSSEDVRITSISSFDERINDFWNEIAHYFPVTIVRNKELLNWRYVSIPGITYSIFIAEIGKKIEGYIVLRIINEHETKIGFIYDITVNPSKKNIIHLLLTKAYDYFSKENVDIIKYYLFNDSIYQRALREAGFIRYPQFFAQNQFCVNSALSPNETDFLKDKNHWFIQLGNSDVL
jgi:RimJ/RimL family protein N-acetyltransferase